MRVVSRLLLISLLTFCAMGVVTMVLFVIPGTPHQRVPSVVQGLSGQATDQEFDAFLQNADRMEFWDMFIVPGLVGALMLFLSRVWLRLVPLEAVIAAVSVTAFRLLLAASLANALLSGLLFLVITVLPVRRKALVDSAA